jgi:hypothetical protein
MLPHLHHFGQNMTSVSGVIMARDQENCAEVLHLYKSIYISLCTKAVMLSNVLSNTVEMATAGKDLKWRMRRLFTEPHFRKRARLAWSCQGIYRPENSNGSHRPTNMQPMEKNLHLTRDGILRNSVTVVMFYGSSACLRKACPQHRKRF